MRKNVLVIKKLNRTIHLNTEMSTVFETEYFINLLMEVPIRSDILKQLRYTYIEKNNWDVET